MIVLLWRSRQKVPASRAFVWSAPVVTVVAQGGTGGVDPCLVPDMMVAEMCADRKRRREFEEALVITDFDFVEAQRYVESRR